MWAIRRASNPIRIQCSLRIFVSRSFYAMVEGTNNSENGQVQHSKEHLNNEGFHLTRPISYAIIQPAVFLVWGRKFSSKVGSKPDKDDDLEAGFSDLEVPPEADKSEELVDTEDSDLESEGDSTGDDDNETLEDAIGLTDIDANDCGKEVARKISSPLFKVIMNSTRPSLSGALDKWVEDKNPLGRREISLTLLNLRKRRLYGKALQFLEWLDANNHIELGERDYASRLDLVAKYQGLHKAEQYIDKIPQSFRGEVIYRTFLANCVIAANAKKSEEVFNKIRDLRFPITTFACNQLLLLYKRVDRKKISDVLKIMEKEEIKPSLFTYKLLVDTKGRIHDIQGMEDVITAMRAEGVEPDSYLLALAAKHYIFDGHNEKAEETLKEIEGDDIKNNRASCKSLLPLYAALGKADDVNRIWKVCEPNPSLHEYLAAIEAWGKLDNIEDAEKVFNKMMESFKKLPSKYWNVLLKVYANHKLLSKGKELAKRMSNSGSRIGPLTWDSLVKLFAEAGEVEKADSFLQKASEQNKMKPLYCTYIYLLEKYADRGDIHNAENIFHNLRQIGYTSRLRQYQLLLKTYLNGKAPAYGFRDRMKADNIFPNKATFAQLNAVDAFRKTQLSELLG